jgi:poly(hydroxyalkanoate) depolymerase family esterase
MKRAITSLAVLVVLGAAMPALAGTSTGTFTRYRYNANPSTFSRDYWVFVPKARTPRAPLVVYLHGCNQTAVDAAVGTRWNELAAKRGFVVVYPEQTKDQSADAAADGRGNGAQCWNWFRPDLFGRGLGEPATVAAITTKVITQYRLDPRRVYVLGASAGADLATVMAALYPDMYAALGVLAGCAYLDCADASGRMAYDAMGDLARPMPVIAFQGTADMVNNFAMGDTAVQQWVGTNDFIDNGSADGSVPATPATVEHHGLDDTALQGAGTPGDVCAYATRLPCLGGAAGLRSYPYSVLHYADAKGRSLVDHWVIHGLNHAYPGGNTDANWTDPIGPDVTSAAYRFFLGHPKL